MNFNDRLKLARLKANLSKASFAKKLGLIYTTYDNYERGTVEPKVGTLCKIADLLNVSTDELLGAKEKMYTAKELDRLAIRNRIMLEVDKQERQWGDEKELSYNTE